MANWIEVNGQYYNLDLATGVRHGQERGREFVISLIFPDLQVEIYRSQDVGAYTLALDEIQQLLQPREIRVRS